MSSRTLAFVSLALITAASCRQPPRDEVVAPSLAPPAPPATSPPRTPSSSSPSIPAPTSSMPKPDDRVDWKADWIGFDFDRVPPAVEFAFAPASWIGFANDPDDAPAGLRLYHATFALPPAGDPAHVLERARLLATGDDRLGVAINGKVVLLEKTNPQRVADVDVAFALMPGDNDVRVLVRNDAPGPAGALVKLDARTAGGVEYQLVSDASWTGTVAAGEDWATRTLDAGSWTHVRVVGPYGCEPWKKLHEPELFLPPTALLRRRFKIAKPVARAIVYASALGLVDVELNGRRVSDDRFEPGWSDYSKRVGYRAHEVTERLKVGDNVLAAELADGGFCGYVGESPRRDRYGTKARAKLQLRIDYADGTSDVVASDNHWEATRSPRREADLWMGEWYDANAQARRPTPWTGVAVGAEIDPLLEPCETPPVQVDAELKPKTMRESKPGTWLFDFGQEITGVARLKVHGRAGQTITLRFADPRPGARALDRFTCSGFTTGPNAKDGFEVFEPRFTFHRFQIVEVTGLAEPPTEATLTGLVLGQPRPNGLDESPAAAPGGARR